METLAGYGKRSGSRGWCMVVVSRRTGRRAGLLSMVCGSVLAACSPGGLQSGSCRASRSSGAALALTSAQSTTSSSAPFGGLLSVQASEDKAGKRLFVGGSRFDALTFKKPLHCSVSLEFYKQGDVFFVDAFSSLECFILRMTTNGNNPKIQVFQEAVPGSSAPGTYVTMSVESEELAERDRILRALDQVPQSTTDARIEFLDRGFSLERFLEVRSLLAAVARDRVGQPEADWGRQLCVAVPQEELDAFDSLPPGERGEDPRLSAQRPRDCQLLFNGHWHTFKIPGSEVAAKRALLESFVAQTSQRRGALALREGTWGQLTSQGAALRGLGQEAFVAERHFRRMQLALAVIKAAGSGCPEQDGGVARDVIPFIGPARDAYLDLAASLLPPSLARDVADLRGYACQASKPAFNAFRAKVDGAFNEFDSSLFRFVQAVQGVQLAMRSNPEQVGLATNHIRNLEGNSVAISYQDLPLFPVGVNRAAELQRHLFSFAAPWLSVRFESKVAHPFVNNLRHEYNDGYAITLAGVPVGGIMAETNESGGVAVLPLPQQAPPSATAQAQQQPVPDDAPPAAGSNTSAGEAQSSPTATKDKGKDASGLAVDCLM